MSIQVILDTKKLDNLLATTGTKADRVVHRVAREAEKRAKDYMKGPRSGKVYQRGGVVHQASAEGEPPAVDTGNLKNSITTQKIANADYEVRVGADYGHWLEFGTSRMGPRPFFTPAVIMTARNSYELFSKVLLPEGEF